MSNIAIFKQDQTPQYLLSVHTPDYESDPDVIINPDISTVENVPLKYWERDGQSISEMTESEKQAIEDKEEADRISRIEKLEMVDAVVLAKALVRAGSVTETNLVQAIKGVLGYG